MRGLNKILAYLITVLLLAGCTAQPGTQTDSRTPTLQPATATTGAKNTATPPVASQTPSPYPTTTHTPTPFVPTETPTYEPDLSGTATVQAVVTAYPPQIRTSYPSPDQKWRAEVVVYNECPQTIADSEAMMDRNSYEALKLINLTDGSERVVEDELLYCGGIGAGGLDGLFWSANSRYFYYTDAAFGMPDGCGAFWQRPTWRLDVTTFNSEGRSGTLSPNHDLIAGWSANEIVVWEINSDQTTHLAAAGSEGSIIGLAWSPDEQAIAYLQMVMDPASDCLPAGKTRVVRVDLSSGKQEVVLVADAPGYDGISWDTPDSLQLSDLQGNIWRYNFVTHEVTQA